MLPTNEAKSSKKNTYMRTKPNNTLIKRIIWSMINNIPMTFRTDAPQLSNLVYNYFF